MWSIPRIWDGGQCIIIGGGASVPRQFGVPESIIQNVFKGVSSVEEYSPYMERIHSQHIIAVNMAYKLGNWVDCMFFGDDSFYRSKNNVADLLRFSGLRLTCAQRIPFTNGTFKVISRDAKKKYGISFSSNQVAWNDHSGGAAINLAVHFGVSRIILLGFDMKLDADNNQHWHKFYPKLKSSPTSVMQRHLKGYPTIANDLKGKVEVINCSPDSAITVFPKINFKDLRL